VPRGATDEEQDQWRQLNQLAEHGPWISPNGEYRGEADHGPEDDPYDSLSLSDAHTGKRVWDDRKLFRLTGDPDAEPGIRRVYFNHWSPDSRYPSFALEYHIAGLDHQTLFTVNVSTGKRMPFIGWNPSNGGFGIPPLREYRLFQMNERHDATGGKERFVWRNNYLPLYPVTVPTDLSRFRLKSSSPKPLLLNGKVICPRCFLSAIEFSSDGGWSVTSQRSPPRYLISMETCQVRKLNCADAHILH
jgi:hypothetical protein